MLRLIARHLMGSLDLRLVLNAANVANARANERYVCYKNVSLQTRHRRIKNRGQIPKFWLR